MESIRGYDKWLTTPPDDDPICEDFCGETLVRNPFSDGWFCENPFCPSKFGGVEQKMAEALVDALEEIRTLKARMAGIERTSKQWQEMYYKMTNERDELEYRLNSSNK